ncbi:MAG TPA: M20/M25/M40 family metallo-hydrolase [Chthonomonadaceae bacterium]|nr:M20/M25/M40 family metallo-hydrolase [Chthonomonadaceae bacterium]
MLDAIDLIRQLVSLPGPPGEENAVRDWLAEQLRALDYAPTLDPKGNLCVQLGGTPDSKRPSVLVTAHLDEIALMITQVPEDGKIRVAPLGGAYTWKWGEGPVSILARQNALPGILSYGSIHTNAEESVVEKARHHPLKWEQTYVFTGLEAAALGAAGVRPGLRVVLAPSRRIVTEFGPFVASYFLDDRADLAVWLMALEALRQEDTSGWGPVTFAATASEEVGGDGAQYLLHTQPAEICIALEIGPRTPEADFSIDSQPTLWVRDGYASMEAIDGEILADCCADLGQSPHWQFLSRGGSDASCAASKGLTARPVTLGLPVENSHGYEIMHRDAPAELTRLLLAYLRKL